MEKGIIVIAHGSKVSQGNKALFEIVEALRKKTRWNHVEPAFLQFAKPTIEISVKKLAKERIEEIIVMPLLIFMGNHVLRDIPKEVERLEALYPQIKFTLANSLGQDIRIIEIIIDRIKEVSS